MIKPVHMGDYCDESPIDKNVEFRLHDITIRHDDWQYINNNLLELIGDICLRYQEAKFK